MEVHTQQLRYLITVAEERSFAGAAWKLRASQQGVSAEIKQLERALDIVLFARTTDEIALTAAGSAFLHDIRHTLDNVGSAIERARGIQHEERDHLVLGTLEGAALTLTEPILDAFRERHPGVTVRMRQSSYDDPTAGLRDDTVDIAFVRRPFADNEIHCETLFSEPLMVMLPTDHRLAGRTTVQVRDLVDETIIGASAKDAEWNAFWELDAYRGGRPTTITHRTSSALETQYKVPRGLGIVVTVASARWLPFPGIRLLPIIDAAPNEVAVGWRGARESTLVRSFADVATKIRDTRHDLIDPLQQPDFGDRAMPFRP
ncbi:LysR substrate-binding domain-containing protein [Nocardia tengchongensis]|uniref:LysR substrate-binding domain-containing protein n=1 Tax=Nocardia tengchongensis TaxID=2055889 RepID=UPI0036B1300D